MLKPTEPKKILCIHDLSGMGRCSLAVILPVLSVMGCQPVALPTVVLSPHVTWYTADTMRRYLELAVDNCERLRDGRTLAHVVNGTSG